jgi:RNA polymerase sigma-70 factor (ECF subfamily)
MQDEGSYVELVKLAQRGDKESWNRLAEWARNRLFEYVYRATLAEDLTQDIIQETMLEMFKFLEKLEKAESFWPWLRKIAANKINTHYRREQRRNNVLSNKEAGYGESDTDAYKGLAELVSHELKEIVLEAMNRLKPKQRHILVLRCYEQMKYSEIAREMGCTEFAARRLFFRAKRSIAKQLSHRGLGRGYLLGALVLFGKMTATSEAAAANISIPAATLKVGLPASLAALATSKAVITTIVTVAAITAGNIVLNPGRTEMASQSQEYKGAEFFDKQPVMTANQGPVECWYYYLPNSNGAVMIQINSEQNNGQSYRQWLQNEQANYYKQGNTIYINNSRLWMEDLSVWRLPTDSPQLSSFLSMVEGKKAGMRYVPDNGNGLLAIVRQGNGTDNSQMTLRYDVSDEEYFRYKWPAGARIIDNRDAMHKRGWTFFAIRGQINGEKISGEGRIPFVYDVSKQYYPWLRLRVGEGLGLSIEDNGMDSYVCNASNKMVVHYEGGSFFKGLGRPWMGLHTIDTVRRDTAETKLWFETKPLRQGKVEIRVSLTEGGPLLVYSIDMEADVVEKVTFVSKNATKGELHFSYLQDIEGVGNEFAPPVRRNFSEPHQNQPGILWLLRLGQGELRDWQ